MSGKRNTETCETTNTLNRRTFLSAVAAGTAGGLGARPGRAKNDDGARTSPATLIRDVRLIRVRERAKGRNLTYIEVTTDAGVAGLNGPLGSEQTKRWESLSKKVRELLVGQDPLRRQLDSEMLWEALYPGRFKSYAEGRDPLTGAAIWGTLRKGRYTAAGHVIMALSVLDNALWDLRGKLLGKPVYRLLGKANRSRVPVYWRQGEAENLPSARQERARGLRPGLQGPEMVFLLWRVGRQRRAAQEHRAGSRPARGTGSGRVADARQPQHTP